jgi:hypothetical protein
MCGSDLMALVCTHIINVPSIRYTIIKHDPYDQKDSGLEVWCKLYNHPKTTKDLKTGWKLVCLCCVENNLGIKISKKLKAGLNYQ